MKNLCSIFATAIIAQIMTMGALALEQEMERDVVVDSEGHVTGVERPYVPPPTPPAVATPAPASPQATASRPPVSVGFWVRLTYNQASDEQMWDQLAEAGATDLFVETFYQGFVIYPDSAITDQRPELAGRDPLAEVIEEGHARGIRVHAWIHCLRWGIDYSENPEVPRSRLVGEAEAWRCLSADGSPFAEFIVSAAYPQVRQRVRDLCMEIVRTHPGIDGINLDYARWPQGEECWYDEENVRSFMADGAPDPRPEPGERASEVFRRHSAAQVTQLVQDIWETVHTAHPDLMISAAFFPGRDEDDAWYKAQDWRRWLEAGYINLATPMCYDYALENILRDVQSIIPIARVRNVPVWAGLAVHQGTQHSGAVDQLRAVRNLGLSGVVFFSHGWVAERPEEFGEIGEWISSHGL